MTGLIENLSLIAGKLPLTILLAPLFCFVGIPLLIIYFSNRKRRELEKRRLALSQLRLTKEQRIELIKDFRLFERLPFELQQELEGLIHIFNAEKEYVAKEGLQEVTSHMKRVIAAQACLLLLRRKGDFYAEVSTIFIQPKTFTIIEDGKKLEIAAQNHRSERYIELAWSTVQETGSDLEDGYNLVLQQFVYQLNHSYHSEGTPLLESELHYDKWNTVMESAYNDMNEKIRNSKRITVEKIGLTDRTKFFAYSTTSFYEKPELLKNENPDLYNLLSEYYRVNPIEWLHKRRETLSKLRLSDQQREDLIKDFQLFQYLPHQLQNELEGLIHVFNDEKEYKPYLELEKITPHMKIVIAAQACLLILRRKHDMYGKLHTVYVCPEAYNIINDGESMNVSGQSSSTGYMIISWKCALSQGRDPKNGHNVVMHESVHQLDLEDGIHDGLPHIDCHETLQQWINIMTPAFEEFCATAEQKKPSANSYYGATNLIEFFAVNSETFYEKPTELLAESPEVYKLLSDFYGVNPAEWLT